MPTIASRLSLAAAALALSTGAAACGSSGAPTTKPSKPASAPAQTTAAPAAPVSSIHVAIRNFAYKPDSFTVRPGAKITFTNYDSTAHTATTKTPGFDSGALAPGKSITVKLTKPGTYTFYCQFHAFMIGHITVAK
jgi:plastocyanin